MYMYVYMVWYYKLLHVYMKYMYMEFHQNLRTRRALYRCTKFMVIVPFWFSMEHLLIVVAHSGSQLMICYKNKSKTCFHFHSYLSFMNEWCLVFVICFIYFCELIYLMYVILYFKIISLSKLWLIAGNVAKKKSVWIVLFFN